MVTTEYKIAYSEVLEILKYMSKEEFNKIPADMVEMFKANCSKENEFVYDPSRTLQEQNVSEIARTIIAILFRDYWATEVQKERILAKQNFDREEIKQKKYNPDNLFKNRKNIIKEKVEEQQLIIHKESIVKRIFSKILTFLRYLKVK